jgi:chemotaxis protein MotB
VTRSKHHKDVSDWEARHGQLASEKDQLAADSAKKIKERDDKILEIESELAAYKESSEKQRGDLAKRLAKRKAEIAALKKQQEQIKATMAQYRKLREAFNKMIDAGELEIYHRRGRIMVALPSSVLFASGKAKLSKAGRAAVAQVAAVLSKLEGRRFLVAGHTDNVPIRTSRFADNWELSAARATTVTRDLIEGGMKPTSLAAAGYGEHDAIRPNNSKQNRKRNRRIEIILMPSISELPELPE